MPVSPMFGFIGPFPMVVANGVLQNSSDVFHLLDPDSGGASTFSVPLIEIGQTGDPTYWAANTVLQAETHNALTTMSTSEFKAFVDQKAAEFGRDPIGSVTAFQNNVQIGALRENPFEFIASLGLEIHRPDEPTATGKRK